MAGQIKVSIMLAVAISLTAVLYFVFVSYFPLSFAEEISYASEVSGIDEELIRAVIWTESKYQEDAVSSAGATGLMQMMPSTRRDVSERYGIAADGSAKSEILLGSLYLHDMLKLTGVECDALMSYNAGYNNVIKWKEGKGEPYKETLDYIDRVNFARRIYKLL